MARPIADRVKAVHATTSGIRDYVKHCANWWHQKCITGQPCDLPCPYFKRAVYPALPKPIQHAYDKLEVKKNT